jgi:predicted dehydrogenase
MKGLLVGYGSIGRRHLTNLHQLGVRDWAVVHTGLGSLPLEPPCPVTLYPSVAAAFDDAKPDFAVIANPSNLHLETALTCVEAGCDFLIEKPVSHNMDGLDELAAAAKSSGVNALVGFQFRFHPALRRIEELLRDRTIGDPLHIRVVWGEYLPSWQPGADWRRSYAARPELGGGVHHTISHPLDYLRMLFGDPLGVAARLGVDGPLGLEVAESADVMMSYPSGATAEVHLDYWSRPTRHNLEIVGSDGTIQWDYINGQFRVWEAAASQWRPEYYPGLADRNDMFVAEARHFLGVVGEQATPVCSLEDGISIAELCAAIERSATIELEPPRRT